MKTHPSLLWLVGDRLLTQERWRAIVGQNEFVRLDGKKLDIGTLANEIDTLPMFVDHKWILVQDFRPPGKRATEEDEDSRSESGMAEGRDANAEKQLLTALGRTGPSVTVILVSETGDKRTRVYKLVQEKGEYQELLGFKDYDTRGMAEWVTARLQSLGKKISPQLSLEFVEAVGADLSQLASEVEKISVAMGSETVVIDQHMEVVAGTPVALRRLVDEGIIRRRPAQAEALLQQTLAANEHPLRVLNFIIPRIRTLLKARLCPEARSDPQKASALFGYMHPFRLKTLYEEAGRFQPAELRAAIHSLVLADTCLKSSVDGSQVLSLLIAALTGAIDHESFARAMQSYVEPWD